MFRLKRTFRFIAVFLALNILVESFAPIRALALTSGPAQPEFSGFEPVATTNMVDPFTGTFTYNLPVINIPGPNGGGYGVSLSYHSGSGMEEESSWVGQGWTLNPGAINRNKSGFADDINKGDIQYTHEQPQIFTVSAGKRLALEPFGFDTKKSTSISASQTRTFNSYKGFGRTTTIGISPFNGIVSLNFTVGDGSSSFDLNVNPGAALERNRKVASEKESSSEHTKNPAKSKNIAGKNKNLGKAIGAAYVSNYGIQRFYEVIRPTTIDEYSSFSIAIDLSVGATPAVVPVGPEFGIYGSYTSQHSTKTNKVAYGSMYLANGIQDNYQSGGKQLDYAVEKEAFYNKRDVSLSIPYNSSDVYSVMGEGIGGGFKYKQDNVGHYFPTPVNNTTILTNGSVEITFGTNVKPGTGLGLGVGAHFLRANPKSGDGNYDTYKFDAAANNEREGGYFRFSGDLSNTVTYSPNYDDSYVAATVGMYEDGKFTNIKSTKLLTQQLTVANETQRAYRSSYVGYTTYQDFKTQDGGYYLRSFTRDVNTRNLIAQAIPSGANTAVVDGQIAEMYTVSEDGNTYVYGLPVLSYKDHTVTKALNVYSTNMSDDAVLDPVRNASLLADKQRDDYDISELHNYPYATTHLLTQIVTPDYIDRTFDGPTADDFGGWTKFNYSPGSSDYTNENNWYNWRMPYKGYEYNRGTLSHTNDDILQYSDGKKQQYYVESIETKTHIAFFVTNLTNKTIVNDKGESVLIKGSGLNRIDAVSTLAENASSPAPEQTCRKLERIILFSKSNQSTATATVVSGKPLKTANFEYYGYPASKSTLVTATDVSNALCKGIPNKLSNSYSQDGKLTLKRVWFDYEGVVNAKITPYEFYYEYKTNWSLPTALATKYSAITSYGSTLTSANQNPDYNALNIDAWSNYMEGGAARRLRLNSTVPQVNSSTFDPAAWQLKRIVLPSGGEILVQYEQADYKYVHDQNATVLTKITDPYNVSAVTKTDLGDAEKHYIDLASIGITAQSDIDAMLPLITSYLNEHKLYFKFLYSLNGTTTNIGDCNVEYITGYAKANVSKDMTNGQLYITFPTNTGKKYTLPKKVCMDFFRKERNGLNLSTLCNNSNRIPVRNLDENSGIINFANSMMAVIGAPDTEETNVCQNMSLTDSYVRIPVLYAKKGGGIRVKRVMMFDPGLETGDQMLYGSEYIYKLGDNKTSSGVTTNEPMAIREENALIDFMQKRSPQTFIENITSGKDKEQFEGPIGEALLPAPSIGYSRVVIKNIHTGKTNTGFTVQEFYTSYDHPISQWGGNKSSKQDGQTYRNFFPGIFVNVNIDKRYASQGYSFVLYEINGKPKRVATYKGDYDASAAVNPETTAYLSYEETYEYTKPGEQVSVLDYNGVLRPLPIGRDEEVVMEMRSISDITDDFSVKVDFSLGLLFIPVPFGTMMFNVGDDEKEMNTHVTNKIIRYTPVLKKTTISKDGVQHISENKVFSISTGKPLVTVTYDGFDNQNLQQSSGHKGTIVNYNVPADFMYKGLSGKFKNEKMTYPLTSASITDSGSGKYVISVPQSATATLNMINKGFCTNGDLIRISSSFTPAYAYVLNITKQATTYDISIQTLPGTSTPYTILDNGLIGSPQSLSMFVIHSGFSNQLTGTAAAVSTYGDDLSALQSPVIFTGGQQKLRSFVNATQVSVQTFKSDWTIADDNTTIVNDFLAGRAGKWRPFETYTQKKAIVASSAAATDRIYNGGVFTTDVFDFNPSVTNPWIKTNSVTLYSADGNPVEEKNVLNIYSAARFGYNGSVPVLVGKNTQYSTTYFNGFEEYAEQTQTGIQTGEFLIPSTVVKGIAHTGNQSIQVPGGASLFLPGAMMADCYVGVNDQVLNKGLMTRFWVKIADAQYSKGINANLSLIAFNGSATPSNLPFTLTEISRVGEWSLIEGIIPKGKAIGYGVGGMTVQINNTSGADLYMDDIRIQPYDAEMACYVYDSKNLRLLASFDDQHFAMIYQYNAEGKLLRKIVETEKGVKTITEAQYNTPQKTY